MSFTSYVPDNITFKAQNNTEYKDLNSDDTVSVDNGTVYIFDNYKESGVYDSNGFLCPESVLLRGEQSYSETVHKNISDAKFIDETVLYLGSGYLMMHFGHFLVEGIARSWALLYPKYKKLKVVIAYAEKH